MFPDPGIYFDFPEDDYRSVPAFSASGCKDIMVSPLDFWSRSWMNKDRAEKQDSTARKLGSAYHKAILEGTEAFDAAYAVKPEPDEFAGLLRTGDELRAECKSRSIKASGSLVEMAARIRQDQAEKGEDQSQPPIWSEIMEQWEAENEGKIDLTRAQWLEIRKAAYVIGRMDTVKNAFKGGMPEVSCFWFSDGVPMKARLDFLKPGTILDLKSFANIMQKEIIAAVAAEVARNRYYIQPPIYCEAYDAMRALYAKHGDAMAHGDFDPAWLKRAMAAERSRFVFIFQQSGDVPNCVPREFAMFESYGGQGRTTNAYWSLGANCFAEGKRRYRHYLDHFGPDVPWVTDYKLAAFRDTDFPIFMLDQQVASEAA